MTNADSALKSYYLEAVSDQLDNGTNPFLAQIKKSSENVWGKEVKKLVIHGINGGIGAGTEDGDLPTAKGNRYAQFTSTLKNLYGTIEITDKAIRASENNSGAFVSLLNSEMDGLLKSSSFNLGRMLFGNGTGVLATVADVSESGLVILDDARNVMEGMVVDFRNASGDILTGCESRTVEVIDRVNKMIKVSGSTLDEEDLPFGTTVVLHGSYNNEITGLGAIFDRNVYTLYGLDKNANYWMTPYVKRNVGNITEAAMQRAIDAVEEASGNAPDMIITSWGVRRALLNVFSANKRYLDSVELASGFKAISYNGIPVVVDRFCPKGTMYMLNTKDFTLHQLCDWQWLADDDGKVLRQIPGKPVYTATLVKYAELMCSRPYAQGALTDINEAD